ncbi:MAG: AAA family ATPase [Planctomycetes bacterium]|nr:AAA family ATPase [Planctomycetota bacterium]
MFRRLTIKNFRSIATAEVDLGSFTVVVGPNGSGKSNFVDALVFLRDLGNDAEAAVAGRGGIGSVVRRGTKKRETMLRLVLAASAAAAVHTGLQHEVTIAAGKGEAWAIRSESIAERAGDTTMLSLGRTEDLFDYRSEGEAGRGGVSEHASAMVFARQRKLIATRYRGPLRGVYRYRLDPAAMRQPQPATGLGRLSESGANIASACRSLSDEAKAAVVATMQKVVPGLVGIRPIAVGRHDFLEFDQRHGAITVTFTASDVSEGALRVLGVVVAAAQLQKNELLILEEPEANVHPGAAALVFDVLREAARRGSVLVTTHSPELLDAAEDEQILVCNQRDGVTRIGPLDSAQRDLVREGLFRLADLMRSEPLRIEGDLPEAAGP